MKKKLLTFEDLYDFQAQKNEDITFSAADGQGTQIIVQEPAVFESEYDPQDGLLKVHLKSCHILRNRNGSSISEEAMTQAIPSFYNRPILGYIHQLEDGSYDFAGHEMFINEDDELEYEEVPVGCIPESCNAQLVYDEEADKTYLEVDGYIYEGYSRAADILQDKESSKVSVEISVDEMSYSASDKVLNIDKFHFLGVTILGKDRTTEKIIEEGMVGSNITIGDFSAMNNSFFNDKVFKLLEQIDTKISNLNINQNSQEGGNQVTVLEQLLQDYNKTIEDLNFDYENMSDDELTVKFAELFATTNMNSNTFSVELGDKKYSFEVSLNDKLRALSCLVNDTYCEQDNVYYSIKAYDDYVIMIDYWTDTAYKQGYKVEDDNYSLTGDRVQVYATYLTKEEVDEVEQKRKDYANITVKLEEYQKKEADTQKEAIFNSEDFECIKESEDFVALVNEADKYSVEEIQEKCDALLLNYVKTNKTFSAETKKKKRVNIGAKKEETYSPYGTLFSQK